MTPSFDRTVCACADCIDLCHGMPGMLVPGDVERIALAATEHAPERIVGWAAENLLASAGALVMARGVPFRIPTLVPARRPDGACRFLTADDKCSIHAVAPFACSHLDPHMPSDVAEPRVRWALMQILDAQRDGRNVYSGVWQALWDAGKRALPPEEGRRRVALRKTLRTGEPPW